MILNENHVNGDQPLPRTLNVPRMAGRIADLDDVRGLFADLRETCRSRVQGRDEVIDLVLTALLADGHVLLEDHPGSGKTTLAKALGDGIDTSESERIPSIASHRRVQFTPDSLPSDVTGVTVYDSAQAKFVFHPGPVFSNVLLADEINRTSPKVQASLLEAMAEKQVTVDNRSYRLDEVFCVIATQNPYDAAGTYPLPRAQLDRFLFKIRMTYLSRENELDVLGRTAGGEKIAPKTRFTPEEIAAARSVIASQVRMPTVIREALVDIARATRSDARVKLGVSTRSLVQAIPALRTWAAIRGRDYVTPQDVADLIVPLFAHRIEPAPGVTDVAAVVTQCAAPILERLARGLLSRSGYTRPAIPEAPVAQPLELPADDTTSRRKQGRSYAIAGGIGLALVAVAAIAARACAFGG